MQNETLKLESWDIKETILDCVVVVKNVLVIFRQNLDIPAIVGTVSLQNDDDDDSVLAHHHEGTVSNSKQSDESSSPT